MRDEVQTTVAVCGERKARLDVLSRQIEKIIECLRYRHATAEIIENVGHGDTRAPNARFTAADLRINRDSIPVVHCVAVTPLLTSFNGWRVEAAIVRSRR